jgi:CRISPR-associated protein Cas5d
VGKYIVQLEVAGPLAMFSRPDTGGTPTSYPVPTWSACKGIFESIAMLAAGNAWINPTRVEVCKRRGAAGGVVRFQRYTTNYGGPLRKRNQITDGNNMQFFATVLADVCYRLYGELCGAESRNGLNAKHFLQELFQRRLRQGRCFRAPSLGWREFTCSYWGAFREADYEVDADLNLVVPSMLVSMWDAKHGGHYAPTFAQEVTVERGVLIYAQ